MADDDCPRGNPIFGDWGLSPRANYATFVDTPVGEECFQCHEPVQEGDVGELMGYAGPSLTGMTWTQVPVHRECMILTTIGHMVGVCSCTDYLGLSKREAAIEAARRLDAGEMQSRTWHTGEFDG